MDDHVISACRPKCDFVALIVFVCLLLVGLRLFKDYGISTDEGTSRTNGLLTYDYVTGQSRALFECVDKTYGTAFEFPLIVIEKLFRFQDPRHVYLMRHAVNFCFFSVTMSVFYLLARRHLGGRGWALLAVFFVLLSPRIFADAFYNSKDIPAMGAFIFGMYTLTLLAEQATWTRMGLHALACAYAIDIRQTGMLLAVMPLVVIVANGSEWVGPGRRASGIGKLVLYGALLVGATIAFWPFLWPAPLDNFIAAYHRMSRFDAWGGVLRYLGSTIFGRDIPWHYPLVWMAITIPVTQLFLACVGGVRMLEGMTFRVYSWTREQLGDGLVLAWTLLPVCAVIAVHSVLYDGWRHLYFIAPAIALLAARGTKELVVLARRYWIRSGIRFIAVLLLCLAVIDLSRVAAFMVRNHPYQHVYFNPLIGGVCGGQKYFDVDYWSLSYRNGLEYIARTDASSDIPIILMSTRTTVLDILPECDRKRFRPVDHLSRAKYVLTDYRCDEEVPSPPACELRHSVEVDGARIMGVYERLRYSLQPAP